MGPTPLPGVPEPLSSGTVTGDAQGTVSIQLIGSVYEINAALQSVKYQSPPNGYGYATLSVDVAMFSDTQAAISGNLTRAVASSSAELTIKIIPKNDAPVITLVGTPVGTLYDDNGQFEVGYVEGREDTPLLIGPLFAVHDPDMEALYVDGETSVGRTSSVPIDLLSRHRVVRSSGSTQDVIYVSVTVEHGRLAVSGNIGATVAFLANYSTHVAPPLSNFSRTDTRTSGPTALPTSQPSAPTWAPFDQRQGFPTGQPSGQPTISPTGQPSRLPTGQPTRQPTSGPTKPNTKPTLSPTTFAPSLQYWTGLPTATRVQPAQSYIQTNTDPNVVPGINPLEQQQEATIADLAAAHFRNLSNTDTIAFLGAVPKHSAKLDYNTRLGGAKGLFVRGQYDEVVAVLESLVYTPDKDWFGVDVLTIYANDLGNIGVDGEKDTTRKMLVNVTQVNDPPVIHLPSRDMLIALEDMQAIIGSDCCNWAVRDNPPVSASSAHALIPPAEHNLQPSTATNASVLSLSISDRDLHQVLRGQRVVVRRTDGTQGVSNVLSNDPLFNTSYGSPQDTDAWHYSMDWNAHAAVDASFTLYLSCTHGKMTMLRAAASLDFIYGAGFQDASIVVAGNLTDINDALRGLLFVPDQNWNSLQMKPQANPFRAGRDGSGASIQIKSLATINITVVDAEGLRAEASVSLFVKPTNDPPVLGVGSLTPHDSVEDERDQASRVRLLTEVLQCAENSACPLDSLVARDVDAVETAGGSLLFTLEAANGSFSLDPSKASPGVSMFFDAALANSGGSSSTYNFPGAAVGLKGSLVHVTVPASMLDSVLGGVLYQPAPDYFGPDLITITVDDLGNTGYGLNCPPSLEELNLPCRLVDQLQIPVNVTSKPDRVEIVLPLEDVQTAFEDTTLVIKGVKLINHDQLSRPWLRRASSVPPDDARFVKYQDSINLKKLWPSQAPTADPTVQPTSMATFTLAPHLFPTPSPTPAPSVTSPSFTARPSWPSRFPTGQPSGQPSRRPTGQPTRQPNMQPSSQPTTRPSKPGYFRGQNTYDPTAAPTLPAYALSPANITYGERPAVLQGMSTDVDNPPADEGGSMKLFRLELSSAAGSLRLPALPSQIKSGLSSLPKTQRVTLSGPSGLSGNYTLSVTTKDAPYLTQTTSPLTLTGLSHMTYRLANHSGLPLTGLEHQQYVQSALAALPLVGAGSSSVNVSMLVCNATLCSYDVTFYNLALDIALLSVDDSKLSVGAPNVQVLVTETNPGRLALTVPDTASRLVYTGTIRDLNIALSHVEFQPSSNLNIINAGLVTIHMTVTDDEFAIQSTDGFLPPGSGSLGGDGSVKAASASADIYVRVAAINDAPVMHVPGAVYLTDPLGIRVKTPRVVAVNNIVIEEEEALPLGAFYITDVDYSDFPLSSMSLTLSAAHGTFLSDNETVSALLTGLGADPQYAFLASDSFLQAGLLSSSTGPADASWLGHDNLSPPTTAPSGSSPWSEALPWTQFRGAQGGGLSLAPPILDPVLSFKFLLSNGTSSGEAVFSVTRTPAVFRAHTFGGKLNNTIIVTSTFSGTVVNGMSFMVAINTNNGFASPTPLPSATPTNVPTPEPTTPTYTATSKLSPAPSTSPSSAPTIAVRHEKVTMVACSIVNGAGTCLVDTPISLPRNSPINITANTMTPRLLGNVITSAAQDALSSIYISGLNNASVYSLDVAGSVRWTFSRNSNAGYTQFSGPAVGVSNDATASSSPELTHGLVLVYFVSSDGVVFALNGFGNRVWTYSLAPVSSSAVTPAPVVRGQSLFVTHAGSRYLYVLDATSGTLLWKWTKVGLGVIKATPVLHMSTVGPINQVAQKMAYLADALYNVVALNYTLASATTAPTVKWQYQLGDGVASTPALSADGSKLYVGCKDGKLYAFNTTTGSVLWNFTAGASFFASSPAVAPSGVVIVGAMDSYLYAVDGGTGVLVWSYQSTGWMYSSPAVAADGTVYAGSDDGFLYSFDQDGTVRWRMQTLGAVQSSPAVASDGSVYFSSRDGYLYSVGNALGAPCKYTADCNLGSTKAPAYLCSPTSRSCECAGPDYAVDPSGRFCTLAPQQGSRLNDQPSGPDSSAPSASQVLLNGLYGPAPSDTSKRVVRLYGTLQEINEALLYVTYVPDQLYYGTDAIRASVCDECFAENAFFPGHTLSSVVKDCSRCHALVTPLSVVAVNNPPMWHAPRQAVTCNENTALLFGPASGVASAASVQVWDPDSGTGDVYVRLRVGLGSLSLAVVPSTVTLLMGTGESDQEIRIVGALSEVNTALAGLSYKPPINWNSLKSGQPDVLLLYVDDLGNTGDTGNSNATTAPRSTNATSTTVDGMAGAQATFLGSRDAGLTNTQQGLSAKASVSIVVLEGANHPPFWSLPGATYHYYPCDTADALQLTKIYTLSQIPPENLCHSVLFVDTFFATEDTLTPVTASSQAAFALASNTDLTDDVTTVSQADGPGEQRGNDSSVQINDVDSFANELRPATYIVTISSMHGVVILPNCLQHGLRIQGGATRSPPTAAAANTFGRGSAGGAVGTAGLAPDPITTVNIPIELAASKAFTTGAVSSIGGSISVIGGLQQINAALKGLQYVPASNFYGTDALALFVNDRAFSPQSGLTSNQTIPIFVAQVVDAPIMVVPSDSTQLTVLEDSRVALTGIRVEDPEFLEFVTGVATYSEPLEALRAASAPGFMQSSSPSYSPRVEWALNETGNVTAAAWFPTAGVLIFSDQAGYLSVVSSLGSVAWSRNLTASVKMTLSAPAVSTNPKYSGTGRFYVGSDNMAKLYSVDIATGSRIWVGQPTPSSGLPAYAAGDKIITRPVVSGGVIYVATSKNYIQAFGEATGVAGWKLKNTAVQHAPVVLSAFTSSTNFLVLTTGYRLLGYQLAVNNGTYFGASPTLKWSTSVAASNSSALVLGAVGNAKTIRALPVVVSADYSAAYAAVTYSVSTKDSNGLSAGLQYRGVVSAVLVGSGALAWQLEILAGVTSTMQVDASTGVIFVFSADGQLYSIGSDSSISWTSSLPAIPNTDSAFDQARGLLYFGAGVDEPFVYAISTTSASGQTPGNVVWRLSALGTLTSAITLGDGALFFGALNKVRRSNGVYKVVVDTSSIPSPAAGARPGIRDPAQRWRHQLFVLDVASQAQDDQALAQQLLNNGVKLTTNVALSADNGLVLFGEQNNTKLVALSAADQSFLWSLALPVQRPGTYLTDPVIAGGTAFVGSSDGFLFAVTMTGSIQWSFNGQASISPFVAPAVLFGDAAEEAQKSLTFLCAGSLVYAISSAGNALWTKNIHLNLTATPVVVVDPVDSGFMTLTFTNWDGTTVTTVGNWLSASSLSSFKVASAANIALGAVVSGYSNHTGASSSVSGSLIVTALASNMSRVVTVSFLAKPSSNAYTSLTIGVTPFTVTPVTTCSAPRAAAYCSALGGVYGNVTVSSTVGISVGDPVTGLPGITGFPGFAGSPQTAVVLFVSATTVTIGLGASGTGSPVTAINRAIASSVVVVADQTTTLSALAVDSGKLMWSLTLSDQAQVAVAALAVPSSSDRVFFSLSDGSVGAVVWSTSAALRWDLSQYKTPSSIKWAARTLWTSKVGVFGVGSGPVWCAPNNTLLLTSLDSTLHALDSDTGGSRWSTSMSSFVRSSPAVAADGTAYVGSDDGFLYAFNVDGTVRWRVKTLGAVQNTPTIAIDGTIYFSSRMSRIFNGTEVMGLRDGYLYSVGNALGAACKYTTDCNLAYSMPAASDPSPKYTCSGSQCVCATGFVVQEGSRGCARQGLVSPASSPYHIDPPYSDFMPPQVPVQGAQVKQAKASGFQSSLHSYTQLHNSWNVTLTRVQQSSLLRVHISCQHGRVMLFSTTGLRFYRVPNATQETERLSRFPAVQASILERMMYTGAAGGAGSSDGPETDGPHTTSASAAAADEAFWAAGDSVSSSPQQTWWRSVLIEGRLGDINRALQVLTYSPDLNWNSQLRSTLVDPMGNLLLVKAAQVDLISLRVSNPFHRLPISHKEIKATVVPANDAPVLRLPSSIYSSTLVTEDQLSPLITDSLTVYTTENIPVVIEGVSVFDVDLQYLPPGLPQGSAPGDVLQQPLAQGFMRVVVETTHGTISLSDADATAANSLSNVEASVGINIETSSSGSGKLASYISFTGPVASLNLALASLTFTPDRFYFGAHARVKITVGDMGNEGVGGEKFDSQVVRVVVVPINNPPTVSIPSDFGNANIQLIDEGSFERLAGAKYAPWNQAQQLGGAVGSQVSGPALSSSSSGGATARKYTPLTPWQSGYELWCLLEVRAEKTIISHGHQTAVAGTFQWDTRQVADIHLGRFSSHPRFLTIYNGLLYFQADNGITGAELWRAETRAETATSNATSNAPPEMVDSQTPSQRDDLSQGMASLGITQFADLLPGADGSAPSWMTVHGNYLYFASAGVDVSWMVRPSQRDQCNSFRQSTFDARVFFAVSDSNVWQPGRLYDCPLGFHWASTEEAHRYFPAPDPSLLEYHNPMVNDLRQWHAEAGAEQGQRHGKQGYNQRHIDPSKSLFEQATSIENFGEKKVYFDECGWDGYKYGASSNTSSVIVLGTLVAAQSTVTVSDASAVKLGSSVSGQGITQGTVVTAINRPSNIVTLSFPALLSAAHVDLTFKVGSPKDRRYFQFSDSHITGEYKHAGKPESYRPDRTPPGQPIATNFFAGIVCVLGAEDNVPANAAFASGVDPFPYLARGRSSPGGTGPKPDYFLSDPSLPGAVRKNLGGGAELWRTDGTTAGTTRIEDLEPGPSGSFPAHLQSFHDYLYFAAGTTEHGVELWRTLGFIDGAEEYGSAELVSAGGAGAVGEQGGIFPGPDSSSPQFLTPAGNFLFMAATDPYRGREAWVVTFTPGFKAGAPDPTLDTYYLGFLDLVPGTASSSPLEFCSSGGQLPMYFTAESPGVGRELWINVDGTAAGSSLVKDINFGSASSDTRYLVWFKNKLYFQANDGILGSELWCHDPSLNPPYTFMVADIRGGSASSNPSFFSVFTSAIDKAQYLVFTATDGYGVFGDDVTEGVGGSQVWRTDGTNAGTFRAFQKTANDLYVDRASLDASFPARLTVYNQGLYLPANYGMEGSAVPKGGVSTGTNGLANNDDYLLGIDQAVVVSDVDTPAGASVTVTLSLDKGLLLLNAPDNLFVDPGSASSNSTSSSSSSSSSSTQSKFLVAEARPADRDFMMRSLLSRGQLVDTVPSGPAAFDAVVRHFVGSHFLDDDDRRKYDAAIISIDFAPASDPSDAADFLTPLARTTPDGIQTIRLIRRWEQAMSALAQTSPSFAAAANTAATTVALEYGITYTSTLQEVFSSLGVDQKAAAQLAEMATYNGTAFSWSGYKPLKIIATSKRYRMQAGDSIAYEAGADLFLYEPELNWVPSSLLSQPYGPMEGSTYGTQDEKMLQEEEALFDNFVSLALALLSKPPTRLSVTASLLRGQAPAASVLMALPGVAAGRSYLGSTIVLTGTLVDINAMFRNTFLYAPYGVSGPSTLSVTVRDHPRVCRGVFAGNVSALGLAHGDGVGGMRYLTSPSNFYQVPALSLLPSASIYGGSMADAANPSAVPRTGAEAGAGAGEASGNATSFCDNNATNSVTRSVPILISAVNAPPSVLLSGTGPSPPLSPLPLSPLPLSPFVLSPSVPPPHTLASSPQQSPPFAALTSSRHSPP